MFSCRSAAAASFKLLKNYGISNIQHMSSKSGTGRRVVKSSLSKKRGESISAAPPAFKDPWVEVLDKASGQVYFWNQTTNETTSLGAPKPTGQNTTAVATQQEPQGGGMMSGLGGVVAQGFAFGVGSSIAHSVVGSMFGGGSSHGGGDSGGGGGGGDDSSFDL